MAGSIASFELWKVDNPEGTTVQYEEVITQHNIDHMEARYGCPWANCPGAPPVPLLHPRAIRRVMWRLITGKEDPMDYVETGERPLGPDWNHKPWQEEKDRTRGIDGPEPRP